MRKIAMAMCVLSLVFAGCGSNDSPTIDDDALPKAAPIEVLPIENAGAYGFNVPTTVNVDNLAEITLDNSDAKEPHQAAMVKLADGKTVDDAKAFFSATTPGGPPPFTVAGGTTAVDPGGKIEISQTLPSGTYVFLCFVPDTTGVPHFAKGMIATINVTGNSTTSLPLPDGENSTSTEYGYELPSLKAGTTTLRTTNEGKQDHEYQFGLLADGKKAADALAWLTKPEGPPPFAHIGGPVIGIGGSNSVKLDLKKGEYVVFCNIPDQTDGKAHYEHGMFEGFSVT